MNNPRKIAKIIKDDQSTTFFLKQIESFNTQDLELIQDLFFICINNILKIDNINFIISVIKMMRKQGLNKCKTVLDVVFCLEHYYDVTNIDLDWFRKVLVIPPSIIFNDNPTEFLTHLIEIVANDFMTNMNLKIKNINKLGELEDFIKYICSNIINIPHELRIFKRIVDNKTWEELLDNIICYAQGKRKYCEKILNHINELVKEDN